MNNKQLTSGEVREALSYIPPDLPHDEWVQCGMAIHSELGGEGFAVFDEWSSNGHAYNAKETLTKWKSFKKGAITIGTLIKTAKDHGYKPATTRTADAGGVKKAKPLPTPKPANKIDQSALARAQERWDSAKPVPADYDHPYLKAKQIPAYGLRVDAKGNLLTPMYQDGKFSCYQAISPVLGEKKPNAPGVSLNEAYFLMGDIAAARRVFIAEGYATGATVHMVTGDPVAVSFGAGRLKLVAVDISRKFPSVQIVMAADDDAGGNSNPGLDAAQTAAEIVGGSVAVPDFGDDRPEGATDFNDLMLSRGKGAVLQSLNAAVSTTDNLLNLYQYDPSIMLPIEFVLDGFISTGMVLIAGAPGVGKTTAIVTAAAYAAGLCDQNPDFVPTIRRKVVYVTEDAGQVHRIAYGLRKHGISKASSEEWNEWFVIAVAQRKKPEEIAATVRHIRRTMTAQCGADLNHYQAQPLTVLDTSNATLDMDDENNNSEAGKTISLIKQELDKGALWLMGHTAKSLKRADLGSLSFRGAGAFEGDCHAVTYLFQEPEDDKDVRYWALGKHRYEAAFREVRILSSSDHVDVQTPWGKVQRCWYRIGQLLRSSETERKEARQRIADEIKQEAAHAATMQLRGQITAALMQAAKENKKLNKGELEKMVKGKGSTVRSEVDQMVCDGLIKETQVGRAHLLELV